MRLHRWRLCTVLKEAEADPFLEEWWRRAPRDSIGWRKFKQFREALRLLEVSKRE